MMKMRKRAVAALSFGTAGCGTTDGATTSVILALRVLVRTSDERDPAALRGVPAPALGRRGAADPRGARGISTTP